MPLPPFFELGEVSDVAVAVVAGGIGLTVLLANPRDPANAYFAAFMGFLAAGGLAGVAHIVTTSVHLDLQNAAAAGADVGSRLEVATRNVILAERMFWIPYIFDPITLLYFASIYPRRNRLHRPAVLVPFAVAALVLLAINVFVPVEVPSLVTTGQHIGPFGHPVLRAAILVYVLAAYLLSLSVLVSLLGDPAGGIARERARLLIVGLGVAVFARIGLTLEDFPVIGVLLYDAFRVQTGVILLRLAQTLIALAALAAWASWARRRLDAEGRDDLRRVVRATALAICALAVLVWLPTPLVLSTLPYETGSAFEVASPALGALLNALERMRYSGRWLIFGGVVGYSILRYQLFDLSTRARRLALQAIAGALLLGGFALLVALVDDALLSDLADRPGPLLVLAVAAALALFLAFDAARRALARRVPEPDAEEVRLRKMEVYRAAVEDARPPEALRTLREEMGLTDAEAAAVETLVRAPRGGPLAPGAVVAGRYRAPGGGRVFLAEDLLLDRAVVLKEVHEGGGAEARLAGALSHPNVVVVHDVVRHRQGSLIVMEYVAGGSLEERLREHGPLGAREAVDLLRGVVAGLAAVHARGVVHGDVKPANVLLTPDGTPKLSDFGVAQRERAATVTLATAPRGLTPRYAAPEVAAGGRATPASDVWSAGRLFLDAVGAADLDALPADVPPEVAAAVRRALARDAGARFPDAAAFLAATGALPAPR